jgi:hypothetical protein
MVWYRLDQAGTYSIGISSTEGIEYMIYQSVDLSTPLVNYKEEKRELFDMFENKITAKKYVMTDPPYYIRVYIPNRIRIGKFTLLVHRHAGISPEDSITCYNPHQYYPEPPDKKSPDVFAHVFKKGERLNPDDTAWFDFDTLKADSGKPKDIDCEVSKYSKGVYRMNLYKYDGTTRTPIDNAGPDPTKLTLTIHDDIGPTKVYLTVTRDDPTLPGDTLAVMWKSNLAIFHGKSLLGIPNSSQLRLKCDTVTAPSNGPDTIVIKMWVDGKQMVDANLGDFEDGDPKGIEHLIPPTGFRYSDEIKVTLDEVDVDVFGSHDDSSGDHDISVLTEPRPTPIPQAKEIIEFDEGKYILEFNLSWQDPGKTVS